jgi:signal peptidase I
VLRAVSGAIGVGAPGEKDFIKRVIGVPGDRVACCTNGHVTVQPEGAAAPVELEEPYVFEDDRMVFCAAGTGESACPPGAEGVLVPEGRLWVMGDHRGSSADSRFHIDDENQGTVPQDKVIGRAFVVVWPLDRAALLSVPDTFDGPLGALPAQALTATPYALGLVGALPVVALRRRWRSRRAA